MTVRDPREVLTQVGPPPHRTLRYGAHPDQVTDFWLPAGATHRPPVVFVHGGFWRAAYDRAHTAALSADLAGRGYPVATIEFRRVGHEGGGWPGTFDDVEAAVSAAVAAMPAAMPAAMGAAMPAAGPVIVAGHSAGGQLALWYAKRAPHLVRGVVALAPVADLGLAYRLGLGANAVAELLGGGPDDEPDRYAAADPIRHLPLGVAVVVVHGSDDDVVPVEIGRGYVTAARSAGGDATLVELPGVEHYGLIDPRSAAWPAVLGALASVSQIPAS